MHSSISFNKIFNSSLLAKLSKYSFIFSILLTLLTYVLDRLKCFWYVFKFLKSVLPMCEKAVDFLKKYVKDWLEINVTEDDKKDVVK